MGITLSFTGCLNTERGGNYQVFPPVPAVVNYNSLKGGVTILTCWGEISTPQLSASEYNRGDCMFVQFKVDYDNQPDPNYFTATEVSVIEEVERNFASFEDEISMDDFTFPIEDMAVTDYNNTALLDGKYFFYFKHEAAKNQQVEYRMFTNSNEKDETTGVQNIYLVAKKKNEAEGTAISLVNSHAFDMKNMILNLGRDTTESNISFKYMKVNLKFFTGKEDDKPVFQNYNSTPIEIAVRN